MNRFWIYNILTHERACPLCEETGKFVANQRVCNKCIYKRRVEAALFKRKFQY